MTKKRLALLVAAALLVSCGSNEKDQADAIQGVACVHDVCGETRGDVVLDVVQTPSFQHQVLTHAEAAGKSDLATGEFGDPAFAYPAIPVDGKFKHQLNFMMTPFAPPYRRTMATNGPLVLYSDDAAPSNRCPVLSMELG
jgi:hypothetical protein